jgi:hypothetical protein
MTFDQFMQIAFVVLVPAAVYFVISRWGRISTALGAAAITYALLRAVVITQPIWGVWRPIPWPSLLWAIGWGVAAILLGYFGLAVLGRFAGIIGVLVAVFAPLDWLHLTHNGWVALIVALVLIGIVLAVVLFIGVSLRWIIAGVIIALLVLWFFSANQFADRAPEEAHPQPTISSTPTPTPAAKVPGPTATVTATATATATATVTATPSSVPTPSDVNRSTGNDPTPAVTCYVADSPCDGFHTGP